MEFFLNFRDVGNAQIEKGVSNAAMVKLKGGVRNFFAQKNRSIQFNSWMFAFVKGQERKTR